MNDIDHMRKLGVWNESPEEFLLKIAKKHGLFAEIKTITEDNAPAYIGSGSYLILGADEKKVAKMASDYSTAVFFPTELLKQYESSDVFTKCAIQKIEPSFCGMIHAIEKIIDIELIVYLFREHGLSLPAILNRSDFQILYRTYKSSLEPRGEVSKIDLKYFLEVVASDKTLEEYEKIHGKNDRRFGNLFAKKDLKYADRLADRIAKKTVKYTPVSPNCVPPEHILDLPYSKSKISVSHGDKGATIRKVDEELGKHPNIKWSLKETTTITPYGRENYRYWHTLSYPTKYEATVASIVNKVEYGLDLKEQGRDFCRTYIKGAKDGIVATAIPIELFNAFSIQAAKDGLEYYFDEYSGYIQQKADRIGICVEDEVNHANLVMIQAAMIKSLAYDSHIKG